MPTKLDDQPATRLRRSKPRKSFPPCQLCKADNGFTWNCECGFAFCHECMNANLTLVKCNGRTWGCPECGRSHILARG
ncbi:MAG: hypothetical protein HQL53_03425 [Magnetococcales bacterium]|nr:hypothetical protein [Magnetococcales bacterium]